jgi:hypothetical protein
MRRYDRSTLIEMKAVAAITWSLAQRHFLDASVQIANLRGLISSPSPDSKARPSDGHDDPDEPADLVSTWQETSSST